MLRYLLAAPILFLLVFCTLSGAASTEIVDVSTTLFKEGSVHALDVKGVRKENVHAENFILPFAIEANDSMMALVQVIRPHDKSDILTKFIGTKGYDWVEKAMEGDGKNWKEQFAWRNVKAEEFVYAAIAKGKKVYVLSASKAESALRRKKNLNPKRWYFKLSVGTITSGVNGENKIVWAAKDVSKQFLRDYKKRGMIYGMTPVDGYAFSSKNGTLVFGVRVWNGKDKAAYVVATSKDPIKGFNTSIVPVDVNCQFNLFACNDELFITPTHILRGSNLNCRVIASFDMGESWGVLDGPLATHFNKPEVKRDSFYHFLIWKKHVLLFTEWKSKSGDFFGSDEIKLLLTDGNKIVEIGHILTGAKNVDHGSFLYANNELFFLSSREHGTQIVLTRLSKELVDIKRYLLKWYPDEVREEVELEHARELELQKEKEQAINQERAEQVAQTEDLAPAGDLPETEDLKTDELLTEESFDESQVVDTQFDEELLKEITDPQIAKSRAAEEQTSETDKFLLNGPGAAENSNSEFQKSLLHGLKFVETLTSESGKPLNLSKFVNGGSLDSSVREVVSAAAVLLCALFGVWAPAALW